MKLSELGLIVKDRKNFKDLRDYYDLCEEYLNFIIFGLQAKIISKNHTNYIFFQYKEDGNYAITRPINAQLYIDYPDFDKRKNDFKNSIKNPKKIINNEMLRDNINCIIYTIQQSIGAILDSLENQNSEKKINGILFEKLIRLVIIESGVDVSFGFENISLYPEYSDNKSDEMKFEHDLVISYKEKK